MELKVEKMEQKELEKLASVKNVADEKEIESSLNYDNLTQDEKDAIEKFNNEINIDDQTQIIQFGSAAQDKVSKFSDSVLEKVRTRDAGETGRLLSNLVAEIKSFDKAVDDSSHTSFFEKI